MDKVGIKRVIAVFLSEAYLKKPIKTMYLENYVINFHHKELTPDFTRNLVTL